jgi:hypothetical protein
MFLRENMLVFFFLPSNPYHPLLFRYSLKLRGWRRVIKPVQQS